MKFIWSKVIKVWQIWFYPRSANFWADFIWSQTNKVFMIKCMHAWFEGWSVIIPQKVKIKQYLQDRIKYGWPFFKWSFVKILILEFVLVLIFYLFKNFLSHICEDKYFVKDAYLNKSQDEKNSGISPAPCSMCKVFMPFSLIMIYSPIKNSQ